MTPISALWLPILLSSVIVFIVSSVIHMAPLWHKNDFPAVPRQDELMDALRPFAIPPGDYMIPRCASREDLRSAEFAEKMRKGPVMMVTVFPNGIMSMARNLVLWFLYLVVVGFFAACVAATALPAGAPFRSVFHYTGIVAFVGYAVALWQMSIWYRRAWSATIKSTLDGLIYALVTAATFGGLWPK